MPVHTSILEILDTQNVSYNITAMQPNNLTLVASQNSPCIVRTCLLDDSQGRVQVLIPADKMVDLDALHRQYGREFKGVALAEIRALVKSLDLNTVPAIPGWHGLPTFIEASLLKKNRLLLESGTKEQMLEISQSDFQGIVSDATMGDFAVDIPTLDHDPSHDEGQIISSVERFTQMRIKQRLDETLEMPPLPETAQRIIKLRADPNADISDLAGIVEVDPSLAAQVVSWAASPYYSAPGKIKSVHDAIVRVLGFDMVLNLALGLALGRTITPETLGSKQVQNYWCQAVYTAALVEGLVTSIPREHRPGFGMSYLSGLLSNFGYLVMAEVFPPYFSNIDRMAGANPHTCSASIENHLMGVTGNQIAAWLLDNWSMPAEVVTAVRQQNNPLYRGDHAAYAKLIFIARSLLAQRGLGHSMGGTLTDAIFEEMHIDRSTAETTVDNILESGGDLDSIAVKMQ